MKTPQVVISPHPKALLKNHVFITVAGFHFYHKSWYQSSALLAQVFLSSVPDSDATVSSENSEGEGPRERERERDGAKK